MSICFYCLSIIIYCASLARQSKREEPPPPKSPKDHAFQDRHSDSKSQNLRSCLRLGHSSLPTPMPSKVVILTRRVRISVVVFVWAIPPSQGPCLPKSSF